jgi:transposase
MRAYSMDLRQRVLAAVRRGESSVAIAARFGVSDSWVRKLRICFRRRGHVRPTPHPGRAALVPAERRSDLVDLVRARPDATLRELCSAFRGKTGVKLSVTTMFRTLRALGFTRKKRRSMLPSASPQQSKALASSGAAAGSFAVGRGCSSSTKAASTCR